MEGAGSNRSRNGYKEKSGPARLLRTDPDSGLEIILNL